MTRKEALKLFRFVHEDEKDRNFFFQIIGTDKRSIHQGAKACEVLTGKDFFKTALTDKTFKGFVLMAHVIPAAGGFPESLKMYAGSLKEVDEDGEMTPHIYLEEVKNAGAEDLLILATNKEPMQKQKAAKDTATVTAVPKVQSGKKPSKAPARSKIPASKPQGNGIDVIPLYHRRRPQLKKKRRRFG